MVNNNTLDERFQESIIDNIYARIDRIKDITKELVNEHQCKPEAAEIMKKDTAIENNIGAPTFATIENKPNVSLSDVIVLDNIVEELYGAVVMPMRYPDTYARRKEMQRILILWGKYIRKLMPLRTKPN